MAFHLHTCQQPSSPSSPNADTALGAVSGVQPAEGSGERRGQRPSWRLALFVAPSLRQAAGPGSGVWAQPGRLITTGDRQGPGSWERRGGRPQRAAELEAPSPPFILWETRIAAGSVYRPRPDAPCPMSGVIKNSNKLPSVCLSWKRQPLGAGSCLRPESAGDAGLGCGGWGGESWGGTLMLPGEEKAPRFSELAFVIGAPSQSLGEQEPGAQRG